MKKRELLLWFLSLVAVVLVLVFLWYPWKTQRDFAFVMVPVAKENLEFRHLIIEDDLEYWKIPQSYLDESILLSQEDIVNYVVKNDLMIPKGSFFISSMLDNPKTMVDRSQQGLKEGQAIVTLSQDLIQVAGNTLQINQKVDLYCIIQNRNEKPITDKLLLAVRILDLRDRKGLTLDDPSGTGIANSLILAIDQEYIPLINSAQRMGTLQVYVTDEAWQQGEECIFYADSAVLPYLMEEE